MGEVRERKVRSDKKISIKPTIDLELYECVSRIHYITTTPLKDVGELICKKGLYSKKVMDHLSKYFRKNITCNGIAYIGDPTLMSERSKKRKASETTRIDIRFTQKVAEQIKDLAYALDRTPSTAVAMLLEASIKNTDVVEEYIGSFVEEVLDKNRKKQLKEVLHYINNDNPYKSEDEILTFSQLISHILDDAIDKTVNARIAISDWLDRMVDDDGED
ncbi:hypothetical protein ACFX4N_24075 [Priestia sp. YIM B13551]|uniref:hypothetical protein n=1 Tax=Priestia sp. YIM B13551 TaxID=3366306 RepID=UPI0036705624